MTAIPDTFRAYVAERLDDRVERGIREFREPDLPPGEVEIRVEWSSVNFKDGLATRFDGKVARISPLIPGIDLAGVVVASEDASIPVGASVLAHGYDLGVCTARRLRRVPARAGRLGRAAQRVDGQGGNGDRHRRLHGRHVGRGARGARPDARGWAGARDRRLGWRRWYGRGDPRPARLRGLGGDRQGGRDPAPPRARRDGLPDPRRDVRRGQAARIRRAGRAPSMPSARPRSRTSCGRSGRAPR